MNPDFSSCSPVPILPVALLVEGRPALVVGGGRMAFRRVQALLEARAKVVVVAEEALPALADLENSGMIRRVKRSFRPGDVRGCAIVFAATDDPAVNRSVLDSCRRYRVLGGCVDRGWREGDFISPAVARVDGMTLAICSGGAAPRRSRLLRDAVARHLQGWGRADLLVMGVSHRTLSLAEVGRIRPDRTRMKETGRLLRYVSRLHEFLILATCNRVELWSVAVSDERVEDMLVRILGWHTLDPAVLYRRRGQDAFEHAARVAAGMDSLLVGESAIAGQVKSALAFAQAEGWAGPALQDWVSIVLYLSRRIRGAFSAFVPGEEVEERALRRMEEERADCFQQAGAVLGTGTLGTRLVQRLLEKSCGPLIWFYHNTRPSLPGGAEGRVALLSLSELSCGLKSIAYLFAAAGADRYLVDISHAEALVRRERVLIVDLGLPCNVNPALPAHAENVHLMTLEELMEGQDFESIERAAALSREILARHKALYDKVRQHLA